MPDILQERTPDGVVTLTYATAGTAGNVVVRSTLETEAGSPIERVAPTMGWRVSRSFNSVRISSPVLRARAMS